MTFFELRDLILVLFWRKETDVMGQIFFNDATGQTSCKAADPKHKVAKPKSFFPVKMG